MSAITNGRHIDEPVIRLPESRLAVIERRITELASAGENRIVALRDALADHLSTELAERDAEVDALRRKVADLERLIECQASIDKQVNEIVSRLTEAQIRRDESKRGKPGPAGPKGERGERGFTGRPGRNGKDANQSVITAIKADDSDFRLVPFLSSGQPASATDLKPLLQRFLTEAVQPIVDQAIAELHAELKRGVW